ncbi:Transmembrane protein 136 [Larimichthys crocea]|uniref:Uncharacterized protein n=1 Tax=Larimichthys crocea TaxID=215358 RepID=A0ACD3R4B6_LARCR|nr:Transmembrane protein 136 [Larimichthys crocea]
MDPGLSHMQAQKTLSSRPSPWPSALATSSLICAGVFGTTVRVLSCWRTTAASIMGILLALLMGVSGCETCGVIFGSEITNPLLQTRWFLRKLGLYDSLLGDAVDLLFILLFATVRVGVGTVMFYCEITSPRTTLIMKIGGVVMYGLAWVFMVDIARFGYKKSRAKYKRWLENHKFKEINTQKPGGLSDKSD